MFLMVIDMNKLLNKIVFLHFDNDVEDLPVRKMYKIFQIFAYKGDSGLKAFISPSCEAYVSPQKQDVFLLKEQLLCNYNAVPLRIPTAQIK